MAARGKYTPERIAIIVQAIELGATYKLAAAAAGISDTTFEDWRNNKPAFSASIKEAEGRGAIKRLELIERAANEGSWQAAAWKLERRYPDEYGKTVVNNQISGPNGGAIPIVGIEVARPPEAT